MADETTPNHRQMAPLFAQALLRELPDALTEWRSAGQIERDVDDVLDVELERCEDMAFGESFYEACPVEGCAAEDYLQRVVDVGGGQHLLTGIRFHYFLEFAFVDIIAATQPLDTAADLSAALEAVRAQYANFQPTTVRLLRASDRPLARPTGITSAVDQHIVVGRLNEIANRPLPSQARDLSLEAVTDPADAAAFVNAAYDEFFEQHPDFATIMYAADEESLQRARETGAVFYIHVAGERAGLIATRDKLGPLGRGQHVSEEILCARFRGRGLGAIAQRLVIDTLAEQFPGALIWGTIDHHNAASRATAKRVGRRELAAWHWLRWI